MNVGQLREIIKDLPDDTLIARDEEYSDDEVVFDVDIREYYVMPLDRKSKTFRYASITEIDWQAEGLQKVLILDKFD